MFGKDALDGLRRFGMFESCEEIFMSLVRSEPLPIDWEAPDFSLLGVDGERYSLDSFKDSKGLLVVFNCNHCPYAQASWPVLVDLHDQFGDVVEFVAINSNDADSYPEDSFDEMKKLVVREGIDFPYLYDELQEVAAEYQAQCTPDVYLFKNEDGVFKLYYHGRINDNWKNVELVKENSLENAIAGMINEKSAPEETQASMGCSIKWK